MSITSICRIALVWLSVFLAPAFAAADANGPIKVIVHAPPGTLGDVVVRALAAEMSQVLQRLTYVENRTGASGLIAMRAIARAKPDGLTIGLGTASTLGTSLLFTKDAEFDPKTDFAPIGMIGEMPFGLYVHAGTNLNSVKDLVSYAREHPKKLSYGSDGVGSIQHLATELFAKTAGIEMTHIPYKGASAFEADLITGRIQVSIAGSTYADKWTADGKIKLLAVTSAQRINGMRNIPSIAESGYPTYTSGSWFAFLAPKGTNPALIERYHAALVKALSAEAVKKVAVSGFELSGITGAQVAERISNDLDMWRALVKSANIPGN